MVSTLCLAEEHRITKNQKSQTNARPSWLGPDFQAALGILCDMNPFELAWGSFGNNWRTLLEHRDVSRLGEDVWTQNHRKYVIGEYTKLAGTGAMAIGASSARVPITSENLRVLATEHSKNRARFLSPMRESLVLVLAHTIFETFVVSICEIGVEQQTEAEFVALFGQRQIRLSEAVNDPISCSKQAVLQSLRMEKNLLERKQFIVARCSHRNTQQCQAICEVYGIEDHRIKAIDQRRQKIVHETEIDETYNASDDLAYIELAGRGLGHLVANCLLGEDNRYFGIQGAIKNGELRLDHGLNGEMVLVRQDDILAILPKSDQTSGA